MPLKHWHHWSEPTHWRHLFWSGNQLSDIWSPIYFSQIIQLDKRTKWRGGEGEGGRRKCANFLTWDFQKEGLTFSQKTRGKEVGSKVLFKRNSTEACLFTQLHANYQTPLFYTNLTLIYFILFTFQKLSPPHSHLLPLTYIPGPI